MTNTDGVRVSVANGLGACRFDASTHSYFIGPERIPSITQMLQDAGLVDDCWFTDASSVRGQAVHDLAASYDLGAIKDPQAVESVYVGWFMAYVEAMRILRPTWSHVETAFISPVHRFGGRPDRVGRLWRGLAVVDLKTGVQSRATPIQLSLQAILVAPELHLPPEAIVRYELVLKETGKWALIEHTQKRDIQVAYDVIRACVGTTGTTFRQHSPRADLRSR